MRLNFRLAIHVGALFLAGCSSPNYYPSRWIEIVGVPQGEAMDTVSAVTKEFGFNRVKIYTENAVINQGGREKVTWLEHWEWSERKATRIDFMRGLTTRNLYVEFADNDTHGFDLIGAPCSKYMEFSSALRKAFGRADVTFVFSTEGCSEVSGAARN